MAAYWKHPCEDFQGIAAGDIDIIHYEKEQDDTEYAKAILCGQPVVTALIGCLYDEFYFHLPFHDILDPYDKSTLIPFLYAVQKPLPCDKWGKSILTSRKDDYQCCHRLFQRRTSPNYGRDIFV